MPYLSLYRKYRPQCFADVVGQDHVVQTLQNALSAGRIANGYLFCGTRGVAKTTIARVFAKCLNCIGPDSSRTAPSAEPCDLCAPCRSISAGQCVDVIEMDAASNRSVSDMAKVRENVQFGPMENRFKTYIVDEAHQLSSDAKDAFLKTLEEPPANVVFILATTESHAIPVTIASRCQQFDFKRGSLATISKQIRKVLELEEVSMNSEAVTLIARAAEGSYRDALSILEQVIAYKREDVSLSDVVEVLGTVDGAVTGKVIALIANQDAAGAFALAEEIFIGGKDIRQFFKTLSAHIRDMLFASVGGKSEGEDPELDNGSQARLTEQAGWFTASAQLRMLEILADAERESKTANQQRLLLEMTLLKLMSLPQEARSSIPLPGALPASAAKQPAAAAGELDSRLMRTDRPPSRTSEGESQTAHRSPATTEPKLNAAVGESSGGGTAAAADSYAAAPIGVSARNPTDTASHAVKQTAPPTDTKTSAEPPAAPVSDSPSRAPIDPDNRLEYLASHWQEVIHHFQAGGSPAGVKVITDARPVLLVGTHFTIEFPRQVWVDRLADAKPRNFLEGVIDKVLRADRGTYRVTAVLAKTGAATDIPTEPEPEPLAPGAAEANSELMQEVIEIFGGRIIDGD